MPLIITPLPVLMLDWVCRLDEIGLVWNRLDEGGNLCFTYAMCEN